LTNLEIEERKWDGERAEADEEQISWVVDVSDVFVEWIDSAVVHLDWRIFVIKKRELIFVASAVDDQVDVEKTRTIN
jgi:hypothetical protein